MLYMGSNQQDSKIVAEEVNKYIEEHGGPNEFECYDLMVGGANILDKINCKTLWGYDISPTLIALHQSVQKPTVLPPVEVTKEMWDECYEQWKILHQQRAPRKTLEDYEAYLKRRNFYSLTEIGQLEWYASFGHGGFSQGMSPMDKRSYFGEAYLAHMNQSLTTNHPFINFRVCDYAFVDVPPGAIIIAHIHSSKNYQWSGKFDKFKFYRWALTKSKTNPIFIIDNNALVDIKELRKLRNEKLYFMGNL